MSFESLSSSLNPLSADVQKCLSDDTAWKLFSENFCSIFTQIGLTDAHARDALVFIKNSLHRTSHTKRFERNEQNIRKLLSGFFTCQGMPFMDVLTDKLSERAEILYGQLAPKLQEITGDQPEQWNLLDWGAGDMEVTRKIFERLGTPVAGCDVRDYRSQGVREMGLPFYTVKDHGLFLDGKHQTPRETRFRIGVMTNVAHHEAENDKLLASLSQYISDALFVVETVPNPHSLHSEEVERKRTFLNDYLYNRLFHDADVPVPGTYENREGWVDRFAAHGWVLDGDIIDLGIDQPLIPDYHVMYVFKKDPTVGQNILASRTNVLDIMG